MTERPKLTIIRYQPAHGKSYAVVRCPCGEVFQAYIWSMAGKGKKCPKCKVVYYLSDMEEFKLPDFCPKCVGRMTWQDPDWKCKNCGFIFATVDRKNLEWVLR